MSGTRVATWMVMLSAAGLAQTSDRPASISGTVTNSVTGEPVVRAHVTAQCRGAAASSGEPAIFGALSNGEGKFTIGQLPVGSCTVSVERVGFVAASRNAEYNLASGAQKEGVKLTLTPAGAIVGRVLDADGAPVTGVRVEANGPVGDANAATDDRGQFRLSGLRAGKYRVKATPQELPFPPEIHSDGSRELHDAASYYPASLTAAEAQWVDVKAGTEMGGTDVRLVRTPIVEVSGRVIGLPADSKSTVTVTAGQSGRGGTVRADGTFSLWRLDPGKYTLTASVMTNGDSRTRLLSAPLDIEVTTANLEHLELRMVPAFDLQGQMRFDEEQARFPMRPPGRNGETTPQVRTGAQRRLTLQPLNQMGGQSAFTMIGDDDSFTLQKVQPGRYRVTLGWGSVYVRSVRAGDSETEGEILDVRNGAPGPLIFTASSNTCEVSGHLGSSQGPAAGVNVMAMREGVSEMRLGYVDADGGYKISGLPPGKYKLFPVDQGTLAQGYRSDRLWESDSAVEIELQAGDKATKDFKWE